MRVFVAALVFALLPGTGMKNTEAMEAANETAASTVAEQQNSKEGALKHLFKLQEDAWNKNDAGAFAATFANDASFINVRGDQVIGREGIEKIHGFIFSGPYKNSRLEMVVDHVLWASDDVAVVDALCTVRDFKFLPPGLTPSEPGAFRTRMRYVMAQRNGEWTIVAGQNTAISNQAMAVPNGSTKS